MKAWDCMLWYIARRCTIPLPPKTLPRYKDKIESVIRYLAVRRKHLPLEVDQDTIQEFERTILYIMNVFKSLIGLARPKIDQMQGEHQLEPTDYVIVFTITTGAATSRINSAKTRLQWNSVSKLLSVSKYLLIFWFLMKTGIFSLDVQGKLLSLSIRCQSKQFPQAAIYPFLSSARRNSHKQSWNYLSSVEVSWHLESILWTWTRPS